MEWQIKYDKEVNLLYIKSFGEMTKLFNEEMVKEAVEFQSKYNIRSCLVDHSLITHLFSPVEVYFQAHKLIEFNVPRGLRIAIVYPENLRDRFEFFETACVNVGYNVKVFGNLQGAKEWLLK